jgi:F-type H+-transporting ATPase subunit epsilon
MAEGMLSLRVVSPTQTVFEGEVSSLVLPGWDGEVGILPGHAPFMTLLGGGRLRALRVGGGEESFFLFRGVAKVVGDKVTVLSEYAGAEPPEGYDPKNAWLDSSELDRSGS